MLTHVAEENDEGCGGDVCSIVSGGGANLLWGAWRSKYDWNQGGGAQHSGGGWFTIFVDQLNIQVTKAIIGKPAPAFSGTAVLNGEFKELKLSDYLGTFLTPFVHFPSHWLKTEDFYDREVFGVFLLPTWLHICLPHWDPRLQWQSWGVQEAWSRGESQ